MVQNRGTCLYKEARLSIEPAYPGSTISFTLPANSTSTFGPQTRPKRTVLTDTSSGYDDDGFAKRHLASDGGMFFRRHHKHPRSFLWRILDSRKTLEIQCTDLGHDASDKYEANLTLLLHFTSPIRPFCIAFAEPDDRDALIVFAITNANEVYTITLHRDFFTKPAASEQEIGDWCKRDTVSLLSTHIPYRLVAVKVENVHWLLVSLDNGGILRLISNSTGHTEWAESLYQQSNWSLRGMLPWGGQSTVRFNNVDLSVSSAAAISLSPDCSHILSVCLDHRLRAFNVETGKLTMQQDLLHNPDGAQERNQPSYIGPSHATLMQVVNIPGGAGADYHIVTYSPSHHQFKFWGVRDADDDANGIYDAKPDVNFIPPVDDLMEVTVWTMEEFFVIPGPAQWRGTELWIRARSGPSSKVYSLRFNLDDDPNRLAQVWKTEWTSVDSGPLTTEALKRNPMNPGDQEPDSLDLSEFGLTEQWLEFLFYPGRFSIATLETALLIYRKGLERGRSTRAAKGSLKDRLCATVTAFATKGLDNTTESSQYELAIAEQWQAFYGLVKDLHKRRSESLALVYDYELDMPWLVLSDYVSAIRKCSQSEVITSNAAALSGGPHLKAPLRKALPKHKPQDVSRLINAAASFRRRFPAAFQQELKRQVELDLLQTRSLTIVDRMEEMEANCDLTQLITEEDLATLVEELGMEVKQLNNDVFLHALETLCFEEQGHPHKIQQIVRNRQQIARYGLSSLLRISQETLEASYNILLDLLFLILFMQFEEDLSEDFDASEIFVELVDQFRDFLVVNWLVSTVWAHQSPTGPSSEALMKALDETYRASSRFPMTQTVLEGIYGHKAFDLPIPSGLKSELLTYWSRGWLSSIFKDENLDSVVENIMGILLAQKEYALAMDFSKLLPDGNWSTYLKGRMHIALGENSLASVCFQKVAYNLGKSCPPVTKQNKITRIAAGMINVEDYDTAALISEVDRNEFLEGLPKYYRHVTSLFEKSKAYTFVADFARLGLRSLMGKEDEALKNDLLQRLFTASIQTSRFDEAYSAMTRHSDAAL